MAVAAPLARRPLRRLKRVSGSIEERLAGLGRFALFTAKVLGHAAVDVIGRLRFWRVVVRHTSDIVAGAGAVVVGGRSEEHTSELQSLMRSSYAVFCLKK